MRVKLALQTSLSIVDLIMQIEAVSNVRVVSYATENGVIRLNCEDIVVFDAAAGDDDIDPDHCGGCQCSDCYRDDWS